MGGQFAPEKRWSVYSGKQPKSNLFIGGQFAPESGGQFDRILQHTTETFFPCEILNFSNEIDQPSVQNTEKNETFKISQIQLNFKPNNDKLNFYIYPNPGSGVFTIDIPQDSLNECYSVNVLDLFSRNVFSSSFCNNKTNIDLSKCNEGIYFITVSNSNYSKTEKIIISK